MKKNCILLFLLSSLVAQANNPDSISRKWQIGISHLQSSIGNFSSLYENETLFPFGVSITLGKKIADKISIETGFTYNFQRIRKEGFVVYTYYGDSFNYRETDKTNIFEVPVVFQYYVLNKSNFTVYLKGGFINSLYFRKFTSETISLHIFDSERTKYFNIIFILGMGAQIKVNEKIGILFEPSIGYFAIGGMQECLVLELKTGVAYHF